MSSAEMLLVRRLQKSANRDETKELIEVLDSLVPRITKARRHRSSLKSGRSLTQLLSDLRCRIEKLLSIPQSVDDVQISDLLIKRGILEAQKPIIVIDFNSLKILSLSSGAREWFRSMPFAGPMGQNLLHFSPHSHRNAVHQLLHKSKSTEAKSERSDGSTCKEPPAKERIITMYHFHKSSLRYCQCALEEVCNVQGQHSFLFFQSCEEQQTSTTSNRPGGFEDFSGVYSFDFFSSTHLPWDQRPCFASSSSLPFIFSGWRAIWEDPRNIAELKEHYKSDSVDAKMNMANRLQLSCSLSKSLTGDGHRCLVKFRMNLPSLKGSMTAGWREDCEIELNGIPKYLGGGRYISVVTHAESDANKLIFTEFHLKEEHQKLVCFASYHTQMKQMHVIVHGQTYLEANREWRETRFVAQAV
ncbi:hypothetical protein GUITHDRAFT_141550 [Guillardia theta CCMP2712]|uniref:Uncharacterized protein n=1 Tax=Guillardia theta (strain CCMP2712) TaxID=905079 RepID=L1J178_GUITC|nr:hypothetical protein GUITHDRAFT_141550 [Guillardia theta CCMP2712]EKX42082.1 hypothetical protein GUITHDRAFT_141550 [Guillardia theta CCMP2712]|eukprot:XP_005829062.1 hypothetical protein GUITHDRAFT_141550 [Guillardia theta CCMP2712]